MLYIPYIAVLMTLGIITGSLGFFTFGTLEAAILSAAVVIVVTVLAHLAVVNVWRIRPKGDSSK